MAHPGDRFEGSPDWQSQAGRVSYGTPNTLGQTADQMNRFFVFLDVNLPGLVKPWSQLVTCRRVLVGGSSAMTPAGEATKGVEAIPAIASSLEAMGEGHRY